MKSLAIVICVVITAFAALANEHKSCESGHHHHEGEEHEEIPHGESVEVSASALSSMAINFVHPAKRKLALTMALFGRMELASNARFGAPSSIPGRITLKVCEFDRVKKGDELFSIDSPAIKSLSSEIAVLENRLEVYRKLKTANAEIEMNLKIKKAEKAALIGNAEELNGIVTVRAAADALIEQIDVADGSWVETGAAVMTLVRPQVLRFRAVVPSADAAKLMDGMWINCGGKAARLVIGIGGADGMVPVYGIFEKESPVMRAGERVGAECVLDENAELVTALPDECIVQSGVDKIVFVRDEKNASRFIAVKVGTGITVGGWTEVKGLPEDGHLEVVKHGAYELKLALTQKHNEKPVGHFHSDGTFHAGEDH